MIETCSDFLNEQAILVALGSSGCGRLLAIPDSRVALDNAGERRQLVMLISGKQTI